MVQGPLITHSVIGKPPTSGPISSAYKRHLLPLRMSATRQQRLSKLLHFLILLGSYHVTSKPTRPLGFKKSPCHSSPVKKTADYGGKFPIESGTLTSLA